MFEVLGSKPTDRSWMFPFSNKRSDILNYNQRNVSCLRRENRWKRFKVQKQTVVPQDNPCGQKGENRVEYVRRLDRHHLDFWRICTKPLEGRLVCFAALNSLQMWGFCPSFPPTWEIWATVGVVSSSRWQRFGVVVLFSASSNTRPRGSRSNAHLFLFVKTVREETAFL